MIHSKYLVVSGIKWSMVSQAIRVGTQFITTIFLARVLAPSDFGLVGMAMVVIGFLELFKDFGTSAAVIQKKEISDSLLSSIFWINVTFGTLTTIFLIIVAPIIGIYYREARVVPVIQVLSVGFFLSGISILNKTILERTLSFKTLAKFEIIAILSGSAAGIGLAIYGAGVWSLVIQSLIISLVNTILLWFSSSWMPKMHFHWQEVKSISNFSLNLVGSNILNYLTRNMDNLLIGRYLGAVELGYYSLAYRILFSPLQNISFVISRVMFPYYSKIQDDNRKFSNVYLKTISIIAFITFPMMIGLEALAKPFILSVFGQKWEDVIILILILAPVGLAQSIETTVGSIYQAKGRTDWMLRFNIGYGIIVIIAIAIGLRWGIVGVALAYAIASFSSSYLNFAIPFRLINLAFIELLKILRTPFINSLIMYFVIIIFKNLLQFHLSSNWFLGLSICLGILFYAAINYHSNREKLNELWALVWNKGKTE